MVHCSHLVHGKTYPFKLKSTLTLATQLSLGIVIPQCNWFGLTGANGTQGACWLQQQQVDDSNTGTMNIPKGSLVLVLDINKWYKLDVHCSN